MRHTSAKVVYLDDYRRARLAEQPRQAAETPVERFRRDREKLIAILTEAMRSAKKEANHAE